MVEEYVVVVVVVKEVVLVRRFKLRGMLRSFGNF